MMKVRADNTPEEIRKLMVEKNVGAATDAEKNAGESRVATPSTPAVSTASPKQEPVIQKTEPQKSTKISPELEF
jgi:hypothetical protein